jgi:hypothetical protein
MLLGCVAHFGIDHTVRGEILGTFRCHPDKGLSGLHHGNRVHEGLQIALERTGVGRFLDPRSQLVGIFRGEVMANIRCQLDDGGWS